MERENTCSQCNLPLIKQNLVNKLPLSAEQRKELEEASLNYRRILECQECGVLCYHKNSQNEPPKNGIGKCKKCGGSHQTTKPKGMRNVDFYSSIINKFGPKIWSCPDHGTVPYDSESAPKRKLSAFLKDTAETKGILSLLICFFAYELEKKFTSKQEPDVSVTCDIGTQSVKRKNAGNYIETRSFHPKKGESTSYSCKDCRAVCKTDYIPCGCHACEDWNGCGNPYKLTSIWCENCQVELI